ncbi:MAG TPA: DNA recombination protein RmuC [Candidatus Binataceae bacterium]|nr:DNA recombination protein RmuC [Candidatus Binataceae bacterium]
MELLWMLFGVALGSVVGWIVAANRIRAKFETSLRGAEALAAASSAEASALGAELERGRAEIEGLRHRLDVAATANAGLDARAEEMRRRFDEQRQLLDAAERKFADAFRALAADALKSSSESFLTLAAERFGSIQQQSVADLDARRGAIDRIVEPVKESLASLDREIRRIENERRGATDVLTDQLRSLSSQTNRLVDALKTPTVRGRWGEIQLRRVVEIAGMVEHCDFHEQAQLTTSGDSKLRPDMIVRLPGGKNVVVDAKAPLQAYMEAIEAEGEGERAAKLRDHARQIRNHIEQLKAKAYWDALEHAPEFVVLFLPGEMFFSAALQQDATLIEDAAEARVILATPTTLIALLKAVGYGWRQASLADNAERISRLGQEIHDRLTIMRDHFARVGASLGGAVRSFNDAVGSFQSRVMPTARRFRELGVGGKQELRDFDTVDTIPREPESTAANGISETLRGK